MSYTRLALIAAIGFLTAGCATTKKVGSGALAVAKAPFQVADAALTGTERVLNIADKAVGIAERTSNFVPLLPGNVTAVRAQASILRSTLNGLESPQSGLVYASQVSGVQRYIPAPSYGGTYAAPRISSSAIQAPSCNTTTSQAYRSATGSYRTTSRSHSPTTSYRTPPAQRAQSYTRPRTQSGSAYRPVMSYSSSGTHASSTSTSSRRTYVAGR